MIFDECWYMKQYTSLANSCVAFKMAEDYELRTQNAYF